MDDEKDEDIIEQETFDDSEIGIPINDIVMPGNDSHADADSEIDISQEPDGGTKMPQEAEYEEEFPQEAGEDFDMPREPDDGVEIPQEAVGEDTETVSEEPPDAQSQVLGAIDGLKQHVETLIGEFETKIRVDEHKNKIIDTLHDELQSFREGGIKKQLYSFVTDVIKVIDDIRKFKNHYEGGQSSEEAVSNLLTFLDSVASDLEDLFSWQGVTPFTCDSPVFETSRQRVIKKLETDDPAKDKTVAESLRPGYEWDGKVIRPEMVAVYVYTNTSNEEDSST